MGLSFPSSVHSHSVGDTMRIGQGGRSSIVKEMSQPTSTAVAVQKRNRTTVRTAMYLGVMTSFLSGLLPVRLDIYHYTLGFCVCIQCVYYVYPYRLAFQCSEHALHSSVCMSCECVLNVNEMCYEKDWWNPPTLSSRGNHSAP